MSCAITFFAECVYLESCDVCGFNSKQKIRARAPFASIFVRHIVVFRLLQKVNVMIAACVSIRTLVDIAFSRAR